VEHFKDGKFHGEYVTYYQSGQIKETGAFKNDKRDGEYVAYDKNGTMKEKALFKNGKLEGDFQSFLTETPETADDGEGAVSSATGLDSLPEKEKRIDDLLRDLRAFEKEEKEA